MSVDDSITLPEVLLSSSRELLGVGTLRGISGVGCGEALKYCSLAFARANAGVNPVGLLFEFNFMDAEQWYSSTAN